MFLYWKKRGAYELETLPDDLTELDHATVERFSWNSAMDLTKDLADERAVTEEKALCCQNPNCADKRRAVKESIGVVVVVAAASSGASSPQLRPLRLANWLASMSLDQGTIFF
ncbi:hypothetical protein lerEdw1_001062 [Lerista edwardsae]|nr:hypothetical protein lerEdw1_001062 [Lerista edwardsae]